MSSLKGVLLSLSLGAVFICGARAQDTQKVIQAADFHFSTKTPSGDPALNSPPDPNGSVERARYCLPRELTLLRVIEVKPSESNQPAQINIDPDLEANCFRVTVALPPPQSVCTNVPRLSGPVVRETKVCQLVPTRISFVVSYEAQKFEAQNLNDRGAVASGGAVTPQGDTSQGDWRASRLVGLNVYNENNEMVGAINDLLTDKQGSIKRAVIGVGGFLGIGEHLIAVPFDQVKFSDAPMAYANSSHTPGYSTTTGSSSTTTGASPSNSSMATNQWYPDHAVLSANKDELKAMPEFKYSK